MKFRKKKLLLLILIGIILAGCSLRENVTEKNNAKEDEIVQEENEDQKSLDVSSKDYDLLIRSEGISDAVVNLFGIDNATTIIFNDMAAVAVEVAEDNTFTEELKQTIVETVKENDKSINKVFVTDDKQIFDEIEEVISALLKGKSYDSQVEKITSIIGKLNNQ